MKYTEDALKKMASPISQSEEEKCKNAIYMVSDALGEINYKIKGDRIRRFEEDTNAFFSTLHNSQLRRDITILVQGSYANKTNIRKESDVDVTAILESSFITNYREGVSDIDYGFSKADYHFNSFKDDVEKALKKHFGSGVKRHDKSIKISGNSYRVDADVVPAYRYRDYSKDFSCDGKNYIGGIEILPDFGGSIINYPEQHIKCGREKNKATNYNYKKIVRIVKSMKEDMIANNVAVPDSVSSFGIESLLWNVPNAEFYRYCSLGLILKDIVSALEDNLNSFSNFKEANGIKLLFPNSTTVVDYQQFVKNLNKFFEYAW